MHTGAYVVRVELEDDNDEGARRVVDRDASQEARGQHAAQRLGVLHSVLGLRACPPSIMCAHGGDAS